MSCNQGKKCGKKTPSLPLGFPGGSDGKESACNLGDLSSIPGSGRSPGEKNGNPLQYSCLENPMDEGDTWATVHGFTELDTTEQLHFHCHSKEMFFWFEYNEVVQPTW